MMNEEVCAAGARAARQMKAPMTPARRRLLAAVESDLRDGERMLRLAAGLRRVGTGDRHTLLALTDRRILLVSEPGENPVCETVLHEAVTGAGVTKGVVWSTLRLKSDSWSEALTRVDSVDARAFFAELTGLWATTARLGPARPPVPLNV